MINLRSELCELDGVRVEGDDLDSLTRAVTAELETRVGAAISETMTTAQLDEFEEAFDRQDDDLAMEVLRRVCPQYPAIVRRELDDLLVEVRDGLLRSRYAVVAVSTDADGAWL